jgi:hypothetical protein
VLSVPAASVSSTALSISAVSSEVLSVSASSVSTAVLSSTVPSPVALSSTVVVSITLSTVVSVSAVSQVSRNSIVPSVLLLCMMLFVFREESFLHNHKKIREIA